MRLRMVLVAGLVVVLGTALGGCASSTPPQTTSTAPAEAAAPEPVVAKPTGTIGYIVDGKAVWRVGADGSGAKKIAAIKEQKNDQFNDSNLNPKNIWSQGGGSNYLYTWDTPTNPGNAVDFRSVSVESGKGAKDSGLPNTTVWPFGAFTSSGSQAYFAAGDRVVRWNLPGGSWDTVGKMGLKGPSNVVLSPDGKKIAVWTQGGVLVMDSSGKNAKLEPNIKEAPFTFSGDGSKLYIGTWGTDPVMTVDVASDNSLSNKQSWEGAVDQLYFINGVVLSHSGGMNYKTFLPEGDGLTEIGDFSAALAAVGFEPVKVDTGVGRWGLSPSADGKFLAVVSTKNGSEDIYVVGADGSETQITKGLGSEAWPEWLN